MIPAWHRDGTKWHPCWLISTTPHGAGQGHVLIAFDDEPHAHWGRPAGSLVIRSVPMDDVRIRRDVIPLMGASASNLPDAATPQTAPSGPDGTELRSSNVSTIATTNPAAGPEERHHLR